MDGSGADREIREGSVGAKKKVILDFRSEAKNARGNCHARFASSDNLN
jgi:hypothetical protein